MVDLRAGHLVVMKVRLMAFQMAGYWVVQKAARRADPRVEMKVE